MSDSKNKYIVLLSSFLALSIMLFLSSCSPAEKTELASISKYDLPEYAASAEKVAPKTSKIPKSPRDYGLRELLKTEDYPDTSKFFLLWHKYAYPTNTSLRHGNRNKVIVNVLTRDLKYHWKYDGKIIMFADSGTVNGLYNFGVMSGVATNLIRNFSLDFAVIGWNKNHWVYKLITDDTIPNKEATLPEIIADKSMGFLMGVFWLIGDIVRALLSVFLAMFGIFVGGIIGTIFHPINTIKDIFILFSSIPGLLLYSWPLILWGFISAILGLD